MIRFKYLLVSAAMLAAVGGGYAAEMFSYSKSDGSSGLRLAWREDASDKWHPIGDNYDFVRSDFGPWGSHKNMFSPVLLPTDSGWVCTWEADTVPGVLAVTRSADLRHWAPQTYHKSGYMVPGKINHEVVVKAVADLGNGPVEGYVQPVAKEFVNDLLEYVTERARLDSLYAETCADDAVRYAGLKPFAISVKADRSKAYPVSDKLIGIFFEDINYGADGGLYAELIQNRDFEYSSTDRAEWTPLTAWTVSGVGSADLKNEAPFHIYNPHYLAVEGLGVVIENGGYDGIVLRKDEDYKFSIAVRPAGETRIAVSLVAGDKTLASDEIKVNGDGWKTYKAVLKPNENADKALVRLTVSGKADIDMVSLFPAQTFRGRENGLRADLAQTLADLKPRFVRFPGGCVAHGNDIDNIYDWKGSVGPLESRRPLYNLWGYHQTRGLGYYEYFLFCEDIGAEPLPVVAAGVPCQNSGRKSHYSVDPLTTLGQQGGIPMEEMDAYVADVLDLIEYANGASDTKWGSVRAAAGHPEPFNLKYIGIGNEDMITEVFEERFRMIYDAVKKAYPEVTVIGTVGPFYEGSDYDRGYELARDLALPMVDEHYYVSPGWLVNNRTYYDNYSRAGSKVYLGEWAAHLHGRPSNIETALAEALYLTDLERNSDVVIMSSYAPLLAKKGHIQWRPDLIYFDNGGITLTPDYYVQKIYGNNSGDGYIPVSINSPERDDVMKRIGVSVLTDSTTGDTIVKVVNMLPVPVTADLSDIASGTFAAERVSGEPTDENARPELVSVNMAAANIPPYSFTVIRTR